MEIVIMFLRVLYAILFSISNILCTSVFCMESSKQNRVMLPIEIFTSEIIQHVLIKLIKEYDNSQNEDKLKIFLKQFLDLQLVNKRARNFLIAPTEKPIKYFGSNESLLAVASQLNSYILCGLILQNSQVTKNDLDVALLFAASNKNEKLFNILIHYGAQDLLYSILKIPTDSLLTNPEIKSLMKSDLECVLSIGFIKGCHKKYKEYINLRCALERALKYMNCYTFMKFLLINNVDPNPMMLKFMIVSTENIKPTMELLIKYGADVDTQSGIGRTPLIMAAICSIDEAVEILLRNNADKSVIDYNKKTAFDYGGKLSPATRVKLILRQQKKYFGCKVS